MGNMGHPSGTVPLFHFTVIYLNAILATVFNGLLIYLIRTASSAKIGSYSNLLLIMALFDIIYAIVHVLDAPLVYFNEYTMVFLPTGLFEQDAEVGLFFNLLYCSFFSQSLVLLMYHFVYRYVVVCRNELWNRLHQAKSIIVFLAFYLISTAVWVLVIFLTSRDPLARTMLADEVRADFGVDLYASGTFSIVYWVHVESGLEVHPLPWFGGLYIVLYMSFIFSIMAFCAISIHRRLRHLQTNAISNAHQLQVQLFHALIIQTVVPMVLEYGPCSLVMCAPMIGLPIDGAFTTLLISTYPVVEPLVVIYFVRDYRSALVKKVRTASSSVSTTWTSGF